MDEFLQNMMAYQVAMSTARRLVSLGIISEEEYREIDTIMAKKHGLSLDSIYRL